MEVRPNVGVSIDIDALKPGGPLPPALAALVGMYLHANYHRRFMNSDSHAQMRTCARTYTRTHTHTRTRKHARTLQSHSKQGDALCHLLLRYRYEYATLNMCTLTRMQKSFCDKYIRGDVTTVLTSMFFSQIIPRS